MLILALAVARQQPGGEESVLLASEFELSTIGYFKRSSAQEVITFGMRTICTRSAPGMHASVGLEGDYLAHVHAPINGPVLIAVCDKEYPSRVAFALLGKVLESFYTANGQETWKTAAERALQFAALKEILAKYQNPREADSLMKVQGQLDETKQVMIQTIEMMLERGQKLETLAEKSNDLSAQSKVFVKSSKKLNSCCVIS